MSLQLMLFCVGLLSAAVLTVLGVYRAYREDYALERYGNVAVGILALCGVGLFVLDNWYRMTGYLGRYILAVGLWVIVVFAPVNLWMLRRRKREGWDSA